MALSAFYSLMENFQGEPLRYWMQAHTEVPAIFVGLYLVLVLYVPQNYMKDRNPMNLRTYNRIWNLLLTVFSVMGSYYCVPRLIEMLTADSITSLTADETGTVPVISGSYHTSVCKWNRGLFYTGPVGFWVCAFILSKIPEMVDTVFLVFQKKPVIFLHWYHHVTVMLYCWHSYVMTISSGLWFATMNYCVHSIMYFYYFVCSMGYRKAVRTFAPLITALQILQMVVGIVVTVYSFYSGYIGEAGCDVDKSNIRMGLLMYASYFVLFTQLYVSNYIKPAKRRDHECNGGLNGHAAANGVSKKSQ